MHGSKGVGRSDRIEAREAVRLLVKCCAPAVDFERRSINQSRLFLTERRSVPTIRTRFTMGWIAVATMAIGGVAADEPKDGARAEAETQVRKIEPG